MIEFREDAGLIQRAEMAATGATIHNIRQLIGAYRGGLLGANNAERPGEHRLWMLAHAEVMARRLEAYITHGDYQKAGNDNPLPPEPMLRDSTAAEVAAYHRWNLYAARKWLHDNGKTEWYDVLGEMVKFARGKSEP